MTKLRAHWLSVLCFICAPGSAALAQSDVSVDQPTKDIPDAGTVCLSRVPDVTPDSANAFAVEVPSSEAEKLIARGFVAVGCNRMQRADPQDKDAICSVAATADASVNALYRGAYLMTAAELCRTAKGIASAITKQQQF